jgi:hypothetical protein
LAYAESDLFEVVQRVQGVPGSQAEIRQHPECRAPENTTSDLANNQPGVDVTYDHNFLRFLPIFGKKLAFFSKTNVTIKILHDLALFGVKKTTNFLQFFWRKYFKIITSVPGGVRSHVPCAPFYAGGDYTPRPAMHGKSIDSFFGSRTIF